jgi:hypothetical protein
MPHNKDYVPYRDADFNGTRTSKSTCMVKPAVRSVCGVRNRNRNS